MMVAALIPAASAAAIVDNLLTDQKRRNPIANAGAAHHREMAPTFLPSGMGQTTCSATYVDGLTVCSEAGKVGLRVVSGQGGPTKKQTLSYGRRQIGQVAERKMRTRNCGRPTYAR